MCVVGIDDGCNPVEDYLTSAGTKMIDALAKSAADAAAASLKLVVAGWTDVKLDPIGDERTGQALGVAAHLRESTYWLVAALAVGAVLWTALRTALDRNGKPIGELVRGILFMVVASGVGIAIIQLLVEASDIYSTWI